MRSNVSYNRNWLKQSFDSHDIAETEKYRANSSVLLLTQTAAAGNLLTSLAKTSFDVGFKLESWSQCVDRLA